MRALFQLIRAVLGNWGRAAGEPGGVLLRSPAPAARLVKVRQSLVRTRQSGRKRNVPVKGTRVKFRRTSPSAYALPADRAPGEREAAFGSDASEHETDTQFARIQQGQRGVERKDPEPASGPAQEVNMSETPGERRARLCASAAPGADIRSKPPCLKMQLRAEPTKESKPT